jgi:glycerol-3-phosphate dehydrogenase (NAD(P)+)
MFEAIPVKHMRSVIERCKKHVPHNSMWVTLSKGIENNTHLLPTEIVTDCILDASCVHISGPSFAQDIAQQQPTCVSIGAKDKPIASMVMACIQTNYFFLTYSSDIIGIQLCGALKNICALGMGFLAGRGYGDNTQSLFFYRIIEESKHILRAMHAHQETIYEPAGIGDYILSCYGSKSRNRDVGRRFGSGQNLCSIIAETGYIPEGINTLTSITQSIHKHRIEAPLFQAVYDIFHDQKSIDIISILTR